MSGATRYKNYLDWYSTSRINPKLVAKLNEPFTGNEQHDAIEFKYWIEQLIGEKKQNRKKRRLQHFKY